MSNTRLGTETPRVVMHHTPTFSAKDELQRQQRRFEDGAGGGHDAAQLDGGVQRAGHCQRTQVAAHSCACGSGFRAQDNPLWTTSQKEGGSGQDTDSAHSQRTQVAAAQPPARSPGHRLETLRMIFRTPLLYRTPVLHRALTTYSQNDTQ